MRNIDPFTYRLGPAQPPTGDAASRLRPVVCERCAAVIGRVSHETALAGLAPELVVATWPQLLGAVQRHFWLCLPQEQARAPELPGFRAEHRRKSPPTILPATLRRAMMADRPAETSPRPAAGDADIVLLVEDDEAVRKLLRLFLQDLGYEVLEARDGQEALRICQAAPRPARLLVTDLLLPGMSGRELAGHLGRLDPELRVVYVTGCTDSAVMERGLERDADLVLRKPFQRDDLAETLRLALDG
jgi:CheY-like chemotaxis protein